MDGRVVVLTSDKVADVVAALNSELRRRILFLLYHRKHNINEIAAELQIPQSTAATNVLILEKAGLLHTEQVAGKKGAQKICSTVCEEVILSLVPEETRVADSVIETQMPVGLYTDFHVATPCGILSSTGVIGYYDNVDSFLNPHRATAQLIWFSKGYVEYRFPKNFPEGSRIKSIAVTAEVCSEFPGANGNWPSDITLSINSREIGTWTSPGDMGDKRGVLTPEWWSVGDSQYGFLKTWKTTAECSFVDGMKSSGVGLRQLEIEAAEHIAVRFSVKEDAENCGGLNLFGREFGNYDKDIVLQIELEK